MKPHPTLDGTLLGEERVLGETFFYERGDRGPRGRIWLRHDQWSLLGNGKTMYDAFRNLYHEARDLWPVIQDIHENRPERASLEWHKMRRFLSKFAGMK